MQSRLLPLLSAFVTVSLSSPLAAQFFNYTEIPTSNPLGTASVHGARFEVMNLDGDSYPDFVQSNNWSGSTAVFYNNGSSPISFTETLVSGLTGEDVFVADLNGDGYDDLVQANGDTITWQLNDGTGVAPYFTGIAGSQVITSGSLKSLAAINLDPSAGAQIVAGCRIPGGNYCLEIFDWDAATPTVLTPLWSLDPVGYMSTYEALEVVDIDADGDEDLLLCQAQVFRNDSTGSGPSLVVDFVLSQTISVQNRYSIESGDLDGDGRLDLAFACSGTVGFDVRTYMQDFTCDVGFAVGPEWGTYLPLISAQAYWIDLADLDGDGNDDVLIGYSSNAQYKLGVMRSRGNGELDEVQNLIAGTGHQAAQGAAVADFDLDGDNDIIGIDGSQMIVYQNDTSSYRTEVLTGVATNILWVDAGSTNATETGATDAPFKTIGAAFQAILSGTVADAVYVRPGHYGCNNSAESTSILVDGVELIGVAGASKTYLHGMKFECRNDARMSGFTLEVTGVLGEAAILMQDATVTCNRLFGGAAMDGIVITDNGYTARIGSNVVHDFRIGIYVEDSGSLPLAGSTTAEIHHNTLVANIQGVKFGKADKIVLNSNLIVGNVNYGVHYSCLWPNTNILEVDFNWVDQNFAGNYVTTVPVGQTCQGTPLVPANEFTAPWDPNFFVDANGLDYHTTNLYPGVDQGDPDFPAQLWLGTDFDGDQRSSFNPGAAAGSGYVADIGADEQAAQFVRVSSDSAGWLVRTHTSPNDFDIKFLGTVPGQLPISPMLHGIMLLSPTGSIVSTGLGAGPTSSISIPSPATIPLGTRFYLQALVGNPTSGALTLTNAVALTIF